MPDLSALLHEVGPLLYGPHWQAPLAHDLDVAVRTVQRWAAGTAAPPPGVRGDLLRRIENRAAELRNVALRLRAEG